MIGYACKYTPVELIAALGGQPVLLNSEADSFEQAERLSHSNLCCYVKALLENCHRQRVRAVFLVNCCDSMRRAYDVLLAAGETDFLFLMDLPDCSQGCAKDMLALELRRFAEEYAAYKQTPFDAGRYAAAFQPLQPLPAGPFIGLMGARVTDSLLAGLGQSLPHPVVDLTCCGNRQVGPGGPPTDDTAQLVVGRSPENGERREAEAGRDGTALQHSGYSVDAYAAELLAQPPCMRMGLASQRAQLLQKPGMAGLVYHTVAFCDFYPFEYEKIRQRATLPLLKLESDYSGRGGGQLSTRVQAFAEGMHRHENTEKGASRMGDYVAGIDSGSTTTNVAVLNKAGALCASVTLRTGPKASAGARRALQAVCEQLGISQSAFARIVATGYGRGSIAFADDAVTEISCHARGARFFNPAVHTIVDIGGQDSKVIRLDDAGNVVNFVMNDKCAAGTGRFLEMMARTLELELPEMAEKGLSWRQDLTISSVCSVFAESEVISLIADDHAEADIVHGLNKAVAGKTAALAGRCGGAPPYMMTGGVACNQGVVAALAEKLAAPVWVGETPELCGAVGAALYAFEAAFPQKDRTDAANF
ncbi:MAG: 2-hydroxyglutaryl-CoA dehydratase [Ruminococcaceae bacterium]|nr:2-hydroxyglutaryl-CoA dehydratase [Oscillospiraceae bacterium]